MGKWFTPSVAVRVNYSGLHFKDSQLSTQEYHHVHADLMWNLLGNRYAKQDEVRWAFPRMRVSDCCTMRTTDTTLLPYHTAYRPVPHIQESKRPDGTFRDDHIPGLRRIRESEPSGDHMLSLTAGFSFSIGKVGWKRAVDHRPYERRNEWLTGYANTLTERNRQYAGKLDKERRTLDELKKILEIEGLLDTYGHLFNDKDDDAGSFP